MTINETWERLQGVLDVLDAVDTDLDDYGVEELETYTEDASEFFDAVAEAAGKILEAMDMLHEAETRKRFVEHRNAKRQFYMVEDFAFAC